MSIITIQIMLRIPFFAILIFTISTLIWSCSGSISTPSVQEQASEAASRVADTQESNTASFKTPDTSACYNNVEFIEDLTVPDGSEFPPGSSIDKRWSVRNTGSCNWTSDYRLVRLDQDVLQSPAEVALYPARAGAVGIWQVDFIAPDTPGEYMSRWQARDSSGEYFGQEVFMIIRVEVPDVQPTEVPTATPTEGS